MAESIQPRSVQTTIAEVRRAALEAKLSKAIEKARRQYLDNTKPRQPAPSNPVSGPVHLGRNIDIKV